MKEFHKHLCARIAQDKGEYRVILLGKHAYKKCRYWYPKGTVLNDVLLLHGCQIGSNCIQTEIVSECNSLHDEQGSCLSFRCPIERFRGFG